MSNTPQTEAQRLADWLDADACDLSTPREAAAELRRLIAVEQRYIEMMAHPCPEWDVKAYMQEIASLRAQLDQAVAEEREACAKVCDDRYGELFEPEARELAAAIRARSNT